MGRVVGKMVCDATICKLDFVIPQCDNSVRIHTPTPHVRILPNTTTTVVIEPTMVHPSTCIVCPPLCSHRNLGVPSEGRYTMHASHDIVALKNGIPLARSTSSSPSCWGRPGGRSRPGGPV